MEFFEIAQSLIRPESFPAVLGTLVNIEGSSYRRVGARWLITASGQCIGSISGGCLENDLRARAQQLATSDQSTDLVIYDTTDENDLIWGVGTGCHGIVRILLERIEAPPSWVEPILQTRRDRQSARIAVAWVAGRQNLLGTRLACEPDSDEADVLITQVPPPLHVVIFGAGDDAIPLTQLCHNMGWETSVFDPRPEMATAARFPSARLVRCLAVETAPTQIDWDDQTVAIIMTHHYRYDLPLLKVLSQLNLPYLGLLGPKQRGQRLLRDAGLPLDSSLKNPVGLDLGGDGPTAVALSIIAEIQSHLHQRTGSSLTTREGSIHAD
jgi:xanthine dehydrogenase accessory factor